MFVILTCSFIGLFTFFVSWMKLIQSLTRDADGKHLIHFDDARTHLIRVINKVI